MYLNIDNIESEESVVLLVKGVVPLYLVGGCVLGKLVPNNYYCD